MVGVMLTLKCLRMWLSAAWLRETNILENRLEVARGTSRLDDNEGGLISVSSPVHLITYNETSETDVATSSARAPPSTTDT